MSTSDEPREALAADAPAPQPSPPPGGGDAAELAARSRTRRAVLLYGLARLLLFLVLTVGIMLFAMVVGAPMPLMIAALLALLVAFPLSMLVFTGMRREAVRALAESRRRRRERRDWVREELANR